MEKFVPYDKLSKKERHRLDAAKRGSWGGLNPVTRKPDNPKAYNRSKARKWRDGAAFPCLEFLPPEERCGRVQSQQMV